MKTLIADIGQIASGDIATPHLDADSLVIVDGKIAHHVDDAGGDRAARRHADGAGDRAVRKHEDGVHTLRVAADARATLRIIIGNDAPSGTGVIPLGVLRTLSLLAGLGGMVLIDGKITIGRSRNTPPAARAAAVVKGSGPWTGGH